MSLPPTKGGAVTNSLGEICEGLEVVLGSLIRDACFRCLRHDLSPVETSQVIRIPLGDEAICYEQVFPAIVIEVSEERAPCPTPHRCSGRNTDIPEAVSYTHLTLPTIYSV